VFSVGQVETVRAAFALWKAGNIVTPSRIYVPAVSGTSTSQTRRGLRSLFIMCTSDGDGQHVIADSWSGRRVSYQVASGVEIERRFTK
jgi:hypothetical protein